jgi:hypothetical protein
MLTVEQTALEWHAVMLDAVLCDVDVRLIVDYLN